jgi:hypothetical protein
LIDEGSRWTQNKNRIKPNESLNEKQQKQMWELLKEFQEVFAWHKKGVGAMLCRGTFY